MSPDSASERPQPLYIDVGKTSAGTSEQVLMAQERFVAALLAAAQTRDALAGARDDAAERRDVAAVLEALVSGTTDPAAVRSRRFAAQDREAAREDRNAAAEDRSALARAQHRMTYDATDVTPSR